MDAITVYTAGPACRQCALTKTAPVRAGLDFEEIEVRTHPGTPAYLQDDLGHARAPVVLDGDKNHWSRFPPDRIHRLAAFWGDLARVYPARTVVIADGTPALGSIPRPAR